jgi:hypothetical protein
MNFSFQIQASELELPKLLVSLRAIVESAGGEILAIEETTEDGSRYTNLRVSAASGFNFWSHVKRDLQSGAGTVLSNHLIIVAEGMNGWSDYRLLHHFLRDEKTDELEAG